MQEAGKSEDPPLKALPKACKRSEVKTVAAVFRSAIASHQPLARLVGERGKCLKNMSAALFAKKCDYANENISAESRRSKNADSAKSCNSTFRAILLPFTVFAILFFHLCNTPSTRLCEEVRKD